MNNPDRKKDGDAPPTFTYHWYARLAGLACMLLFGVCGSISFVQMVSEEDAWPAVLIFPGSALCGLALFLWTNRRWTVRDDGITARSWYGRERMLYWEEMDSIQGTGLGDGIRIKNRSGKTLLALDPWIGKYDEFVEALRLHKSELFDRDSLEISGRNLEGLKRSPALVPFGMILSFGLILFGIAGVLAGGWPMAIFILAGGYVLYGLFRMPTAVHISGDSLRLEYLRGSRTVKAAEIRKIYPTTDHSYHGSASARAVIELANGKKIELSGYRDGTPMVVNVLRNWLEKYPAPRGPSEQANARTGSMIHERHEEKNRKGTK
jgi:hypothetical protein